MSNKQIITAMAKRYVDRKFGLCVGNSAMRKGFTGGAVLDYARNWLSQHGSMPEGLHTVAVRKLGPVSSVEVDYTRLLHDPDYPEPYVREHYHVAGSSPPVSENT